jgi:MFS family permease
MSTTKSPLLSHCNNSRSKNTPGTKEEDDGGCQIHQQSKWFTPQRVLVLFCCINFLNYLDRGALASNGVNGVPGDTGCKKDETCFHGSGIQNEFGLTYFQDGIVSSGFMVGLVVASPIFAHLSKQQQNPFRLIGVGLLMWVFGTIGCGMSTGFWSITTSRMLVGVGEASFVTLAAPFILDVAPPSQSSSWLSIFYMFMPVGVAMGYVYGGVVGGTLGWRAAFWIESVLMLPFAVFGFVSEPIYLKGHLDQLQATPQSDVEAASVPTSEEVGPALPNNLLSNIKELAMCKVYTTSVLGYVIYSFVMGAYSYWGPKAGQEIFHIENADEVFGGVTILAGIVGTYCGGRFLDYIGSSVGNSFKLLGVATTVGATGCLVAFMSQRLVAFITLLAVGEFFLFATQGPVNGVSVRSVDPQLQALAMAISTDCIHFLWASSRIGFKTGA